MTEDWKKYENEVYEECCRIYGEENVERDVTREGLYSHAARQLDVLVHTEEGDIVYDAKYYSRHVSIKTVESMIGMYADLGVSKFVVVTNIGYSKAALRRAHMGTEKVEADVLSLGELKQMQAYGALLYAGRNAITLSPPFGWIVDGQRSVHPEMVAVLYRRGLDFKEAMMRELEFAYLGLWDTGDEIHTVEELSKFHRDASLEADPKGKWEILEEEPCLMTRFKHSKAVDEYIGYREFENFILYVILFCDEEKWHRNRQKLIYVLEHAIPMSVVRRDKSDRNYNDMS